MKPMLARTKGPKFSSFPCYIQPKLNGIRALYQRGTFQSRDEKVWHAGVLDHLIEELFPCVTNHFNDLILDGELYRHGWRLQRINGAVATNRKEPSPDTSEICFHVFDVVDPSRTFSNRWFEIYHGLVAAELPHIRAVPTSLVHSEAEVEQHFHLYTREGYEGIMLRPDGPYEFGEHMAGHGQNMTSYRSKFLWKYKQWEDDEFICDGATEGEGKADIGIGALWLRTNEGALFKVGTGFTDEERLNFYHNVPIGKLVRIRYLCLTDDGIPFNPSFVAVMSN